MHSDFHKNNIRACFNKAALTYDQHSLPQQIIGERLINIAKAYQQHFNASIDIGCGSGLITEKLVANLNSRCFYAIDIAEDLVALANERLFSKEIKVSVNDFENFSIKNVAFDFIFSNMALQWSLDFYKTLLHFNKNLNGNSLLAFSIPIEGNFPEISTASKNQCFSIQKIKQDLISAGFCLLEYHVESLPFQFDAWKDAIKSIKATGASYLFHRERNSLSGTTRLKNNWKEKASLTYEVGYFIARKFHHVD